MSNLPMRPRKAEATHVQAVPVQLGKLFATCRAQHESSPLTHRRISKNDEQGNKVTRCQCQGFTCKGVAVSFFTANAITSAGLCPTASQMKPETKPRFSFIAIR